MHLGLPVLALAATEASRAVPPEAGRISANVHDLVQTAAELLTDPDEARTRGMAAREFALARYGLAAFLAAWDNTLSDITTRGGSTIPVLSGPAATGELPQQRRTELSGAAGGGMQ